MLLQLRRGPTVVTLSGDGATIAGCTYVPRAPDIDEQQVRSILRSGGELSSLARRNVTESASVILSGSASEILAQARAVETLFPVEEAQRRTASTPVYVEFCIQDSGPLYRAEILVGRVEWPNRPVGPHLAGGAAELLVSWTRRYFWEDTTLHTVPLSNGNGTDVTTGLTIWNHNDGHAGHDNFVAVAGAHVQGVIPAPARVELLNNTDADYALRNIYIGHNVQATPGALDAVIEGETSTAFGATVSDGASSGGSFRRASWGGAQDHTSLLFDWTLSRTLLGHTQGNAFRLLARFANAPSGPVYAKVSLRYPAHTPITVLQETGEVLLGGRLADLGILRLPPIAPSANSVALALVLTVRSAGSGALDVDFIQLTALDSWRHVQQLGYVLEADDRVIDDGGEAVTYGEEPGGDHVPIYAGYGQPVHLWPGADQRLSVLWDEEGGMNIARTFAMALRYRPRRLTL